MIYGEKNNSRAWLSNRAIKVGVPLINRNGTGTRLNVRLGGERFEFEKKQEGRPDQTLRDPLVFNFFLKRRATSWLKTT